eukprot:10279337-Ditylum_brightwellii.AAC.1
MVVMLILMPQESHFGDPTMDLNFSCAAASLDGGKLVCSGILSTGQLLLYGVCTILEFSRPKS